MPHANRPSGPSKPIHERRDAVTEREERDEVRTPGGAQASDPMRSARQAERAAHTRSEPNKAAGSPVRRTRPG